TGTGLISVRDASVVEGDAGTQTLSFTVRRAGGTAGTGSVDYSVGFGTADAADLAPGAALTGTVSFAAGETSKTISVAIAGDIAPEANETLTVTLGNAAGAVAISDGNAIGTIVNDDLITLKTFEVQGAGHRSAYEGQAVITRGIVTAIDGNGFYIQDADGDGNNDTSDGLFVFTGGAPSVAIGDAVQVRGVVSEFLGGGDTANLSVTQISGDLLTVLSSGNAVPAATLIGTGGRTPPTQAIEDDGFTSYDPATDGLDFYESLEGMRVTVDAPLVVAASNNFGETFVVASGGAGATGVSARGGITISDGDFNPERIQIDADSDLFAGYVANHSQGDRLDDVTGVLSYGFGSYELLVTEAVTVTSDVTLGREAPAIAGNADRLTIATYNVENLSANDDAVKFDLLANDIIYSLRAPDIIAVQEIQDADGAGRGSDLSGQASAQALIDAIVEAGGPTYLYVEIAPATAGSTGGEPGGNIRNGYLYNPNRVDYVEGSAQLLTDGAFNGSRQPLAATFTFAGQDVTAINIHLTSRIGSDPLMGANQPPANAGEATRNAQTQAVRDYVDGLLAVDPALNITVLGDFNAFYFEDSLETLEAGGVLSNLHRTLSSEERYSYVFDGNLQALDHMLVTGGLLSGAQYDAVHINAELVPGTPRGTDHDPQVASFFLPRPVANDDAVAVDEDGDSGNLWSQLLANDSDADGDALTISAVDGSGTLGSLVFDADTQSLHYV
ncbi:MAG: Ig-like domain-containing protein, partial [Pseudomonadota bacterium]|nr:Ig-like domain-containing protein [Pseudomonadota bacterium]